MRSISKMNRIVMTTWSTAFVFLSISVINASLYQVYADEKCETGKDHAVDYIVQSNYECFSELLNHVSVADIPGKRGVPLVHWAALNGDSRFLSRVLEAGADKDRLNNADPAIPAPIFTAILSMSVENIETLIHAGADLNVVNSTGWSPLRYAANLNRYDMVLLLLQAGADWSISDKQGKTLVYRIETGNIAETSKYYEYLVKVIDFLRGVGVDVDEPY